VIWTGGGGPEGREGREEKRRSTVCEKPKENGRERKKDEGKDEKKEEIIDLYFYKGMWRLEDGHKKKEGKQLAIWELEARTDREDEEEFGHMNC
jgi:hypothetical protein